MRLKKAFSTEQILLWLTFLSIIFLLFYRLGSTYLTNWDEAWYADIARNMLHNGNFLTPIWNHHPFFDKPPLYFWLETLSFKIFGVTEFAARFFSSFSALGACVITYLTAKLLFNKKAALISFLIIGSTIGFLYRSRTGNLDAMLTFFIMSSIYFFYRGLESSKYFIWMGISLALGFLTKGAVVFIFPVMALFYYVILKVTENASFTKVQKDDIKWLVIGAGIGVGVPLLWFLISYLINGQQFLTGFSHNQIGKISNSGNFLQNFSLEYINYLKSGQKFWFIIFIPAFFWSLLKWRDNRMIIIAFFLIYFLILSVSENKSNWFLMPLYPITALMTGDFLAATELLDKKWLSFGVLMLVGVLALTQVYHFRSEFIVPETETDEVEVALAAKQMTSPNDFLYLTGLSYPTIIYYSDRESYATFGGQNAQDTFWVLPGDSWQQILQKSQVYIITSDSEMNANPYFHGYNFQTLFQSGDRKLLKKL